MKGIIHMYMSTEKISKQQNTKQNTLEAKDIYKYGQPSGISQYNLIGPLCQGVNIIYKQEQMTHMDMEYDKLYDLYVYILDLHMAIHKNLTKSY